MLETVKHYSAYLRRLNHRHYILLGVVVAALVVWAVFFRLPLTYSAEPIAGRVVDAETGRPIEGAIVIAVWELERGFGLEGSTLAGALHVAEVLTDEDGYYTIDGWGPKWRPGETYLSHNAPKLVVFKEGYDFFAEGNRYDSIFEDNRRESVHRSSWDKATIRLEKFKGSLEEYYQVLKNLNTVLWPVTDRISGAGDCDWKKIPKMILMFDKYHSKLEKLPKGRRTYHIPEISRLVARGGCGTEEEFIKEYSQ